MIILAVGAHPDDVEICCFGTLAKCTRRGDTVIVCSVSNGNLGHHTIDAASLRPKRMAEGAKASQVIGASFCCMDVNDTYIESTDTALRKKLTELIRSVKPDVIITHDNSDYHNDHIETNRLVSYCLTHASLANVVTENPPLDKKVALYYMDKVGGGTFIPTEYVDISETFTLKLQALACHVSQLDFLKEHDGIELLHAVEVHAEYRGMFCRVRYAECFRSCTERPVAPIRLLP